MAMKEYNIASMNRAGFEKTGSILTDHPDMRLVKLSYLLPLSLILIAVVSFILPISDAAKIAIGFATFFIACVSLSIFIPYHDRLRKAIYTVTTEYIEAQTGTFEKRVRRVPLCYIRDVTHSQNFFQSLFRLSDVKVAATNGDSIVLENVFEGESKREIIWELVLAKSPNALRSKHTNS